MTANVTPRQHLMLPNNSDLFLPGDFVATNNILDAAPGITPVANYAALPTGLTVNQNGNQYLELDNGALWYWYNPSGTGVWKRSNNCGVLSSVGGASVSSTSITPAGGAVVATATVTAPGGRYLRISANFGTIDGTGSAGMYQITILVGATTLLSQQSGHQIGASLHDYFFVDYLPPTPNTSLTFQVKINTVGGPVQNPIGAAATTASTLTIAEL